MSWPRRQWKHKSKAESFSESLPILVGDANGRGERARADSNNRNGWACRSFPQWISASPPDTHPNRTGVSRDGRTGLHNAMTQLPPQSRAMARLVDGMKLRHVTSKLHDATCHV